MHRFTALLFTLVTTLFIALLPLAKAHAQDSAPVTPAERLAALINEERAQKGLVPVPVSRSLSAVAEAHVRDLQAHPPSGACNMHSWSASGSWTPCCYTADHAQARCMWVKPAEITGGAYRGDGFEISASRTPRMTPAQALESWRGSSAHYAVIMNQGMWARFTWRAIGVGVSENYAVVWFGTEVDAGR